MFGVVGLWSLWGVRVQGLRPWDIASEPIDRQDKNRAAFALLSPFGFGA